MGCEVTSACHAVVAVGVGPPQVPLSGTTRPDKSSQQLQIRSSFTTIDGPSSCLSCNIASSTPETKCLPRPPSQGNLSILRLRMPEKCRPP